METASEEVTLSELIHLIIDSRTIDMHVSLPARVDSYNASAQTVDVTPMVNKMVPDGATPPNYVSEKMPKLADVPVAQLRGGGFFAAFPLQAGDTGMVVFCERNMAAWRATGNQSDPGDLGLHTMSSAWFIPAVAPDSKALQNADATNLVIGSDTNGSSRIVIKPGGEIDMGAAAAQYVAMADRTNTMFNTIINLLNSIFGSASTVLNTTAPGAPDAVYVAMKAAVSALYVATTWPSTAGALASTNLKAED